MKTENLTTEVLLFDLQFFNAESEGRTEPATAKKRSKARSEGQVAKSNELNTAVILITFFGIMGVLASYYLNSIYSYTTALFYKMPDYVLADSTEDIPKLITEAIIKLIFINGPLWIVLFMAAFLVSIIQVGFKPTFKPMRPKFNKMNPLKGLKKFVSKDMIVELLKNLGKVIALGAIFLNVLLGELDKLFLLASLEPLQILMILGNIVKKIGFFVGGSFLGLAVLDYMYQRYKFFDGLKMTKQEVKDEFKQAEGDPQVKGKIRQKMREMSMRRMMQAIPQADVIITNPTHFAVAIQYDAEKRSAPIVVAKGVDFVAQKIKEKGKEHHIELVENKPLARALYYTVEIQQEIPPELYGAVAEVLAYVYSLENKKQR
jgi:flagellar biosynthetic protein FlhB